MVLPPMLPSRNDSVCFLSNFLPATSFFAGFDDVFAMFFSSFKAAFAALRS